MVSNCSVPGCSGRKRPDEQKLSMFRFPKDEFFRKRWVVAIRRKDFTVTKYSTVCERHFKKSDIVTEASAFDSRTGRTITAPLLTKRLMPGAIPSLNLPRGSLPDGEEAEDKQTRLEKEQLKLALQKSLENIKTEPSELNDVIECSFESASSNTSRLTNCDKVKKQHEIKIKRKRKSEIKDISNKKVNGSYAPASEKEYLPNSIQEVSNSHILNDNSSEVLSQKIQVKEENPWEEYLNPKNTSKSKPGKSQDTTNAGTSDINSETCKAAFYKKPLQIDKRARAFGKFIACEMSDLRGNPELYLKTQQSILKILVEAHFQQMSSV